MNRKWNIGWGPVSGCNMNCRFCYSKGVRDRSRELPLSQWIRFVDENHHNINSINYGTGENTLSDEWFQLIEHVSSNYHIPQALTTNGYIYERIHEDPKLEKIFIHAIEEIDISLDFADREKHNHMRGQPKAYDWAINTLKYCSDKSILTTIVFIGTDETLNFDNIRGLFDIAKKYGAKLRMNIFRPTMEDRDIISEFICSYEKILEALKFIGDNYKILSIGDPLFSAVLTKEHFEEDPSGDKSIRILSDGSITPSTYLISQNFIAENIQTPQVLEKLQFTEVSDIRNKIPDMCVGCPYEKTCAGGVYDRRYLWFKDFNRRDSYCPFREENYIPGYTLEVTQDEEFTSIHHGYLPTIFFSN